MSLEGLDLSASSVAWWVYTVALAFVSMKFLFYYFGWEKEFILFKVAKRLINLKFNS